MKKKIFTLLIAACVSAAGWSQTLSVQRAAGVWCDYDANQLKSPSAFDATGVTLSGHHYTFSDGVVMTMGNAGVAPDAVRVVYGGGTATVHAAASLADVLVVRIDGANVEITVAPTFDREITCTLTGSGSSFVLHGDYKSTVVLDGIKLQATGDAPALWIDNGKRINIEVADGTDNAFRDAATNAKKSAFFVKGHAEWRGGGTVSVAGTARHAYSSNEYTAFKPSFSGHFNVTAAAGDAMHVDQYCEISGGTFNLTGMQGDGIDVAYALASDGVTKTGDEHNGEFIMKGGTITVTAAADDTKGVKCDDRMTITAGRINATASGKGARGVSAGTDLYLGAEGASVAEAYLYLVATGGKYEFTNEAGQPDSSKCRGLKVKRNFYHYPSTVERGAGSTVTAKNLIDVDGEYAALGGQLVNAVIE